MKAKAYLKDHQGQRLIKFFSGNTREDVIKKAVKYAETHNFWLAAAFIQPG